MGFTKAYIAKHCITVPASECNHKYNKVIEQKKGYKSSTFHKEGVTLSQARKFAEEMAGVWSTIFLGELVTVDSVKEIDSSKKYCFGEFEYHWKFSDKIVGWIKQTGFSYYPYNGSQPYYGRGTQGNPNTGPEHIEWYMRLFRGWMPSDVAAPLGSLKTKDGRETMKKLGIISEEKEEERMIKIGKVNEAGDVVLDEDSKVLEVTATTKTGVREDGLVCLGESELGSIYVNDSGEVLNEAVINHYFPYRDKKTGAVVLAGEVNDEGEVEYWTTDNDFDSMPVDDFLKKFKKGTIKDLDLFDDVGEEDDIDETEGLDLKKTSVNGKMVTLWINGKKYSYEPTNGMSAKEMAAKFTAIAKHSEGKALAWVKKNAKTNDSYKKAKTSEEQEQDNNEDKLNEKELYFDDVGDAIGKSFPKGFKLDYIDNDFQDGTIDIYDILYNKKVVGSMELDFAFNVEYCTLIIKNTDGDEVYSEEIGTGPRHYEDEEEAIPLLCKDSIKGYNKVKGKVLQVLKKLIA